MTTDRYEIERFQVPGLPWRYRVKADRAHGPEYATRAEAEARREELLNRQR